MMRGFSTEIWTILSQDVVIVNVLVLAITIEAPRNNGGMVAYLKSEKL